MHNMYKLEEVRVIANNIKRSLQRNNLECTVTIENGCKCIAINNDNHSLDENLYIWIRLIPVEDKYIVDISNIYLPIKSRHKGVFTNIFYTLKRCKYVDSIKITSVCSIEMNNWCNKNKLKSVGSSTYGLDYISK